MNRSAPDRFRRHSTIGGIAAGLLGGLLLTGSTGAWAQTPPEPTQPAPSPSPESLLPVPEVALDGLEPEVAEQLRSSREVLAKTLDTPGIPAADLAENFGLLGQIYHAYGLTDAARACYLNANSLAPANFKWNYYLGSLAIKEGRLAEAVEPLQRALAFQPENVTALVRLGEVYLQQGELPEARDNFLKAMTLNRNNPAATFGLGQVALSNREYPDAVGLFHKTLALVPDANAVHYPLALAYRGLGLKEEAERHLKQQGQVGVTVADPLMDELATLKRGEIVFLLRGREAFQAGRYKDAAELFLKAAAADPQSARARINASAALAGMGDYQGASDQLRRALDLQPEDPSANYNMGTLLLSRGLPKEAKPFLEKAVELNPRDDAAHLELGRALLGSGSAAQAAAEFREALRINPANEDARLEVARRLVEERLYGDARSLLETALREHPGDGRTIHALARILAASPDPAVRDGHAALPLALRVFEAHNSVGYARTVAMAYAEIGECQKAAQWLSSVLEAVSGGEGLSEELTNDLRFELNRYQQGFPCRPPIAEP